MEFDIFQSIPIESKQKQKARPGYILTVCIDIENEDLQRKQTKVVDEKTKSWMKVQSFFKAVRDVSKLFETLVPMVEPHAATATPGPGSEMVVEIIDVVGEW